MANFTISDEIYAPVLAAIVGLEVIGSVLANSFALIMTLIEPKVVLKQPSLIYLANIVVMNLLMTVIFLFPVFMNLVNGGLFFGKTTDQLTAFCQFSGFLYSLNVYLLVLGLAVISVDRCLFIIKPFIHKKYMKPVVAVAIVVSTWVLACFVSALPFMWGIQDTEFLFDEFVGTCGSVFIEFDYEVVFVVFIAICIIIIIVSTVITYVFTRKFIIGLSKVGTTTNILGKDSSPTTNPENVYNYRLLKVFGIFSMLLIATALCYSPGFAIAFTTMIVGRYKIPGYWFSLIHVCYFMNYTLIPLIQLIFRKEVKDFLKKKCCSRSRDDEV